MVHESDYDLSDEETDPDSDTALDAFKPDEGDEKDVLDELDL